MMTEKVPEEEGQVPLTSNSNHNVKANDILKMLAETSKSLKPFQAFDNSVYVMLQENKDLLQMIQAVAGKPYRLVSGHEKDVVQFDELMSAIRTHANQVVKKDTPSTSSGEENSSKTRKTILEPLLELHRVLANASCSTLALYHLLNRASNPGIAVPTFFSTTTLCAVGPAPPLQPISGKKRQVPDSADAAAVKPTKKRKKPSASPKKEVAATVDDTENDSEEEEECVVKKSKSASAEMDEKKKKKKKKRQADEVPIAQKKKDKKDKKKRSKKKDSCSGSEDDSEDSEFESSKFAKKAASLLTSSDDDENGDETEEDDDDQITSKDIQDALNEVNGKASFAKQFNEDQKKKKKAKSAGKKAANNGASSSSSQGQSWVDLDLRSLSAKMVAEHTRIAKMQKLEGGEAPPPPVPAAPLKDEVL